MKEEKNFPDVLKKIDWTTLRTQKASLLATIDFLEKNKVPQLPEDLDGILNLIDALQDYAVDEMGVPEMHVFDFELEEDRENPDPDKTKSLWLCPNCGSDNVEFKVWANANTNEVSDTDAPMEDEDCFCNDCKEHGELILSEVKANAKIEGFQVVDDEAGDIHPDMDGSFCLYNMSQAQKMLHSKHDEGNWKLLAIWTGDVEEPTIMFEGDPRD